MGAGAEKRKTGRWRAAGRGRLLRRPLPIGLEAEDVGRRHLPIVAKLPAREPTLRGLLRGVVQESVRTKSRRGESRILRCRVRTEAAAGIHADIESSP